jgi:hypothetical protein
VRFTRKGGKSGKNRYSDGGLVAIGVEQSQSQIDPRLILAAGSSVRLDNPKPTRDILMCAMAFKDTRLVSTPKPAGVPSPKCPFSPWHLATKEV